jgi:hypothetical protein
MISAQIPATDIAPGFVPLAMIFAIVAASRKSQPIGGWLMFFYYQNICGSFIFRHSSVQDVPRIHATAVVQRSTSHTVCCRHRTTIGWLPDRHDSSEHSPRSAKPAMVGTSSLRIRSRTPLYVYFLGHRFCLFPECFQANFGHLAVFVAWFGYFYGSQRVHHVFVAHDWPPTA